MEKFAAPFDGNQSFRPVMHDVSPASREKFRGEGIKITMCSVNRA